MPKPKHFTLGEAVDLFLAQHKATTALSYTFPLVTLRDWIGGSTRIAIIPPVRLLAYWAEVIKPRKYAAATNHKHVKTLRTFFNWCVKAGLIEVSPAGVLQMTRPKPDGERDKAMSDDDLYTVLDHLRHKKNVRDYTMVLFLADTGCRRGGVAGLRVSDLNLEELTATVTEKGGKSRAVDFSQACADALIYWLSFRARRYPQSGQDYVFTRDGAPMLAENVSRALRRACHEAGVKGRGSHSLRHRKGHQLSDAGVSPSVAATVLGHSETSITMEYYYPHDRKRAQQAARAVMTKAPPLRSKSVRSPSPLNTAPSTSVAPEPIPPMDTPVVPPEPERKSAKIIQFPGTKPA